MPTSTLPSVFETLDDYLEAVQAKYDACLSHVDHDYSIDGVDSTLRLHYVNFDGNGRPKFKALAESLVDHITLFCIAASQRQAPLTATDHNRMFRKARDLFRKLDKAGEPGEILLYFLLETVLKAPQVVCKMSLKTNPNDEVKGADGIHIRWNSDADCLNIYLGEAKLYQSYGSALKDALESIESLHTTGRDAHELALVTAHFKHIAPDLQDRVSEYIDQSAPVGQCKIVHACLIGYDWSEYKNLDTPSRTEFIRTFETEYHKHAAKLTKKTQELFRNYSQRHLSYEFFFLPFRAVQDFRDEFNRALTGEEGGS